MDGVGKIHRRLPSKQRPAGAVRRRSRKGRRVFIQKDRQHDLVVRWSVSAGLLTLVAVIAIFSHWLQKQRHASASADGSHLRQLRLINTANSPTGYEAVEMVKAAMTVTSPEGVGGYFHLGDRSPQEVLSFLKENNLAHPDTAFSWIGSLNANRLPMEGVSIEMEKEGTLKVHMALLHPDRSNIWKIDYPALARICTPSWEEIDSKQPESARVRAIAAVDNYFNGPFDDRHWFCFRLNSPDLKRWHYAYCRMDSLQAKAMRRILTRDARSGMDFSDSGRRVVLDLKRLEGAQDNQFQIERVVAEDWVIQNDLFDATMSVD